MRILLIHTAGGEGSVALADTTLTPAIVATEALPGRSSSERLVPSVRRLLEASAWKLSELGAVGVVHGPGSFTGIRVGLSAAKGLSEAAGPPLVAISRLALLAASVDGSGRPVHAVLDAGRGEYYFGEYLGRRRLQEALLSGRDVIAAAAGGIVVACEPKVGESLVALAPQLVGEPSAGDALPLVLERIEAGDFDDAATLDGHYLRRTDVELLVQSAAKVDR